MRRERGPSRCGQRHRRHRRDGLAGFFRVIELVAPPTPMQEVATKENKLTGARIFVLLLAAVDWPRWLEGRVGLGKDKPRPHLVVAFCAPTDRNRTGQTGRRRGWPKALVRQNGATPVGWAAGGDKT